MSNNSEAYFQHLIEKKLEGKLMNLALRFKSYIEYNLDTYLSCRDKALSNRDIAKHNYLDIQEFFRLFDLLPDQFCVLKQQITLTQ